MRPGHMVAERFEIDRLAGSGGMGEVWKALDRRSGQPVAIKVLLKGRAHDDARFAREAHALAELSHPGIVRYVAHGLTESGEPFLAMEWLEGEDLSSRLARGRLSVSECAALAAQAAEALAAAHARDIVHRDLKPSNLFLVGGGAPRVKLVDFGIARISGATRVTGTGLVVGTPGYMAPEQARSDQAIDARADVFSLGCVLYECLTGEPAFAGHHALAILAKILIEEPRRARELRPDVPADLDALIARMLAKAPDKRPRDGGEVALAVAALDAGSARLSPATLEDSASPRAAALGGGERRAIAVVLIGPLGPPRTAGTRTLADDEAGASDDELRRAAEACGGRFELLLDGSALALFTGAKTAVDRAKQAARSALVLRDKADGRPIALATGLAEVMGQRPTSEALDRAAAMLPRISAAALGSARPGRAPIALDEVTAGLLDMRFEVAEGEGGLWLHGERELDAGARTRPGKAARFVGRERELRSLEEMLGECVEEPRARAVLVTAGAGVGKSRLRQELVERARVRPEGIEIWMAEGDPMRAGAPFGLLRQLVRRAARLVGGEPLAARQEKLLARVGLHVEAAERRRVTEFLGELIGTPFSDAESVKLRAARQDAKLLADQMRRAWIDLLLAECRARPVLLVLEDLHWGDTPTVECIDAALRLLRRSPLMVVGLARPEVREAFPSLWGERGLSEIGLRELSPKACERLVRDALGEGAPAATVAALVERSEGNAFFLEELTRAAAEGRAEAPGTVLAMLQSRLEALPLSERRLLRAGSVLGEVFWRGAVEALSFGEGGGGEGGAWLDAGLAKLEERDLITRREEAAFPGEEEYVFRHGLLREAAYRTLTERDRAIGHRLAGEWLARAGEPDATVIAEHFERAGEARRAAGFYHRAAEQALRSNDLAGAIARALRAEERGAGEEALGELLLIRTEAHFWRGDLAEAERLALAAMGALPQASDKFYAALRRAVESAERLGRSDRILALSEALCAPGPAEGMSASQAIAAAFVMGQCASIGALDRASALAATIDAAAGRFADDPRVTAAIESGRGMLAFITGDLGAHREHRAAALASFERAGDARAACHERCWLAVADLDLGMFEEARDLLRGALAEATRMDLRFVIAAAKYSLGLALAGLSALDEARAVTEAAIEEFIAQGDERRVASSRASLAAILLSMGSLDRAEAEIRRSVEVSSRATLWRPLFVATLADVLLAQGRAQEALAHAREAARARVDERRAGASRGDGVGESRVSLVYAAALAAVGAHEEARGAIAAARDHLLARAGRIRDPALRRGFLARVPENARTLELARAWLGEGSVEVSAGP